MKVVLINPAQASNHMAKTSKVFMVPQNTLASVAALTPYDEVEIIDELVEDIDFDVDADIIGITAMTDNVVRAYQVAEEFRKREIPVVMGGSHPSARPEESLQYCDAVVNGEAEGVWEDIVENLKKGKRPGGIYKSADVPDMNSYIRPRRDLIKKSHYMDIDMVQTSRGCPYQCEFCSVFKFFGQRFRHRPVKDIIEELEQCGKYIFFVDDILTADKKFAKELFRAMIPLKKNWIAQVTINAGKDEELTRLMGQSGCCGVFIGFESVDQETLKMMRKRQNRTDNYLEYIKRMQDSGIPILGAFVFGFDTDNQDVFDRTVEFVHKTKIDIAQFTIITPFPGTDLYDRWETEGRLRFKDWWLDRHWTEVVFNPTLMTPEQLQEGWVRASMDCYKTMPIISRVTSSAMRYGLKKSALVAAMNISYRESVINMKKDILM